MAAPRSAATRRAHRAARAAARSRAGRPRRTSSWSLLGPLWIGGLIALYVILLGSAIAQAPGGTVLASLVAMAWALVCCAVAARLWSSPLGRRSRLAETRDRLLFLGLHLALVSPAATHWMASRRGSGSLEFGTTAASTVATAQALGWVAFGIIAVGCPAVWAASWLRLRPGDDG